MAQKIIKMVKSGETLWLNGYSTKEETTASKKVKFSKGNETLWVNGYSTRDEAETGGMTNLIINMERCTGTFTDNKGKEYNITETTQIQVEMGSVVKANVVANSGFDFDRIEFNNEVLPLPSQKGEPWIYDLLCDVDGNRLNISVRKTIPDEP